MVRGGPFRIHSRMASTCRSAGSESRTMASENPSRYLRTEYSHAPDYTSANSAPRSSELTLHQTPRKIRCLRVGKTTPSVPQFYTLLFVLYQLLVQRLHLLRRLVPIEPRRGFPASRAQPRVQSWLPQYTSQGLR